MKARLLIKVGLLLPFLLFSAYSLMALIGCAACWIDLGDRFYCGPFCTIGGIVLGMTVVLFFFLIFPEIKSILKFPKNASSNEE